MTFNHRSQFIGLTYCFSFWTARRLVRRTLRFLVLVSALYSDCYLYSCCSPTCCLARWSHFGSVFSCYATLYTDHLRATGACFPRSQSASNDHGLSNLHETTLISWKERITAVLSAVQASSKLSNVQIWSKVALYLVIRRERFSPMASSAAIVQQ